MDRQGGPGGRMCAGRPRERPSKGPGRGGARRAPWWSWGGRRSVHSSPGVGGGWGGCHGRAQGDPPCWGARDWRLSTLEPGESLLLAAAQSSGRDTVTDPSGLDSFLPVQRPLSQTIQRGLRGHSVHPGLPPRRPASPPEAILHFSQAPSGRSGRRLPSSCSESLGPTAEPPPVPHPMPCPQPSQGAPRVFTASMPLPRPFLCLGQPPPHPTPPPNCHFLLCKAQPSVTTPGKLFSAPMWVRTPL